MALEVLEGEMVREKNEKDFAQVERLLKDTVRGIEC